MKQMIQMSLDEAIKDVNILLEMQSMSYALLKNAWQKFTK